MDKEQFRALFTKALEAAVVAAQEAHNCLLQRPLRVELHGAGSPGTRMTPDQALENLFINDNLFWRIIDVAVIGANEEFTIMFVRASGHTPSPWDQTWDPDGAGPFQVTVAGAIRNEPASTAS